MIHRIEPIHRRPSPTETELFDDLPTPTHQATTLDEFTVARIERLWKNWRRYCTPEQPSKHRFHHNVIKQETGLADVRLATVYVLLARYDAAVTPELSPA